MPFFLLLGDSLNPNMIVLSFIFWHATNDAKLFYLSNESKSRSHSCFRYPDGIDPKLYGWSTFVFSRLKDSSRLEVSEMLDSEDDNRSRDKLIDFFASIYTPLGSSTLICGSDLSTLIPF